jgi:hypothetical protein
MRQRKLLFSTIIILFSSSVIAEQEEKLKLKVEAPEHILTITRKDKNGNIIISSKKVFERFGKIMRDGDIVVGDAHDFHNGIGKFSEFGELSLSGKASSGSSAAKWPQSIIPYTLNPAYSTAQKNVVLAVLSQMETNTGLQFVQRSSQINYIHFTYTDPDDSVAAGRSYVGMQGGKQELWLNPTRGFRSRTITHEMGHALGYEHEHQRADRDSYITIDWSNLDECSSFFDIDYGITMNTPYDIYSVMHYSSMTTPGSCVFDASKPMFIDKSGNNIRASSTFTPQDMEVVTDDYGHFPGVSNLNWSTDACYGGGTASWSAMPDAVSYIVKYVNGGVWDIFRTTTSTSLDLSVPFSTRVAVVGVNSSGEYSAFSNIDYAPRVNGCF